MHPIKYSSISTCFTTLLREQGPSAFWWGWAGKFFGYGVQGACRFGLYEYFKKVYSNVLVDQNKSLIFFASSASAEVIANVALCPFEAIKVRVQAQPHFAKGLSDGFPRIYASEGLHGYESNCCTSFLLWSNVSSYWLSLQLLFLTSGFTGDLFRYWVVIYHVSLSLWHSIQLM